MLLVGIAAKLFRGLLENMREMPILVWKMAKDCLGLLISLSYF
jgi:hypothetical protein